MVDSINDLIIRIKNGYMAKKEIISVSHSVFALTILNKLKALGFVKDFKTEGEVKKTVTVELVYNNGSPRMTDVKTFSSPGRRHYVSYRDLKPVLNGYGFSLLSTSKGILTNREARKEKIGGELLFNIW